MIAKRRQKFFFEDQWKKWYKKRNYLMHKNVSHIFVHQIISLKTNQLDNSLHLDKNKLFQSAEVNFSFGLAYNKQVLRLGKEC